MYVAHGMRCMLMGCSHNVSSVYTSNNAGQYNTVHNGGNVSHWWHNCFHTVSAAMAAQINHCPLMRALVCYSSIARFPFLAASRLVSQLALRLMWANLNSFRGLTGLSSISVCRDQPCCRLICAVR